MEKIKKAIFPVAGLGTRFFPLTKIFPKETLPLIDKPLIQYAIEEALASEIEEFIFITGLRQSSVQGYFNNLISLIPARKVHFVHQEKPLGLGHAILCAQHLIHEESFAILLSDEFILSKKPCLQQMIDAYEMTGGNIVAIHPVNYEDVSHYGIVKGEKLIGSNLTKIEMVIEKPSPEKAPSRSAIVGRYILNSRIFEFLRDQMPGVGEEIQLTDSLASLLSEQAFYGLEFEGQRFDCGSKKGYITAILKLAFEQKSLKKEIEAFLIKEGFSKATLSEADIL